MSTERSYWIKSGFFTLMERGAVLIFGFASAAILFRELPRELFGVWVLFLAVATIFEQGRTGLQQNALVKFLTTSEGREYSLINTASLCLNLIVTCVIAIGLLFLATPLSILLNEPRLYDLLLIYCLTNICLLPYFQFNFVQQANLRFDGIFWSTIAFRGSLFLYIVVMAVMDLEFKLIDLAIARTVSAALGGFVSWFFARNILHFDFNISWRWVRKLFHYGKFTLGTSISTMLYKTIDKAMLSAMLGAVPVAIYEAAMKITNYTEAPTFAAASILFPQSARRMKEGKEMVRELYEKAVGGILTFIFPVVVLIMLFAELFVLILAGSEYPEAPNLLRLTILYGFFIPFAVQFGTVLDSIGKPKINFWFTMGGALINIISNYIFISLFGMYGAVYGTLTTYIIAFIAMQTYLNRTFGVVAFRAFKYMLQFYGMLFNMGFGKLKDYTKLGKRTE
ncbi:MAG: flippase [Bacteroidota bacterium]